MLKPIESVEEKLLDPVVINMAIITDRIFAKGWIFNGYTKQDNLKIFRYK